MSNSNKAYTDCLGALLAVAVVLVVGTMLNGWVLTVLWAWFVVPVFALPLLSTAYAIGIASIIGFLTHQYQRSDNDLSANDSLIAALAYAIGRPLLLLAFGWIVLQFV